MVRSRPEEEQSGRGLRVIGNDLAVTMAAGQRASLPCREMGPEAYAQSVDFAFSSPEKQRSPVKSRPVLTFPLSVDSAHLISCTARTGSYTRHSARDTSAQLRHRHEPHRLRSYSVPDSFHDPLPRFGHARNSPNCTNRHRRTGMCLSACRLICGRLWSVDTSNEALRTRAYLDAIAPGAPT